MPRANNTKTSTSRQLRLPIEHAPPRVRFHGYSDAHSRPLVAKTRGGRIVAAFRVPPPQAWLYRYLELNPANSHSVLLFDCDDAEAWVAALTPGGSMPEPSWCQINMRNGHAHLAYCLRNPVHRNPESRWAPQRWAAAISGKLGHDLGADRAYSGLLSRNPMARPHRGTHYKTRWGHVGGHLLEDLGSAVGVEKPPRQLRIEKAAATALGRNCCLFENLMRFAGRRANLRFDLLAAALDINRAFDPPLGFTDVKATAKSVERYRKKWIEEERFFDASSAAQRGRQARSAAVRRQKASKRNELIVRYREGRMPVKEIAAQCGCSRSTVQRVLRASGGTAERRIEVRRQVGTLRRCGISYRGIESAMADTPLAVSRGTVASVCAALGLAELPDPIWGGGDPQ